MKLQIENRDSIPENSAEYKASRIKGSIMLTLLFGLMGLAVLLAACAGKGFSVKGTVYGITDNDTIPALRLEKADHAGIWQVLDSAELSKSGKFSFSSPAPAAPEIYRLALGNRYIYFPIDSLDHINVETSLDKFGTDFSLGGSDNAAIMERFEKDLHAYMPHAAVADSARNFKRRVYTQYLQNARGSVVSYYILTKTIGNEPLFNDPDDAKYFAAVATSFAEFRPNDPRAAVLRQAATSAMRQKRAADPNHQPLTLAAEEVYLPELSLLNEMGETVTLSSVAGNGVPVLLVFSDQSAPETPALNVQLRKLTDAGKVKIYNVGLDTDQLAWRNAVQALPWTNVYAGNAQDARVVTATYQVATLPTIFYVDARGNLTSRLNSLDEIK